MAYKCNICQSVFEGENCPRCGGVILIGDKMMTQLFPEGVKMGPQCVLVAMEKVLFLPDKAVFQGWGVKNAVAGAIEQAARNGISQNERIIPYQDILKADYPAEDVKVGLFKRKGDRSIRVYRKSTGKYYDICFGRAQDAKSVFDLLKGKGCI